MRNRGAMILALVAVALTVGVLWVTNRAVTPKEATWAEVLAEAATGGYRLITTEELSRSYREDAGSLLLVDTRQEWEYRTGHIRGALNFPIEPTWWSRWRKAPALETLLGHDRNRAVIFY
jgi:3-mercaptopyruvate sulfurtransferase SseA